jgi:hypothetical protein
MRYGRMSLNDAWGETCTEAIVTYCTILSLTLVEELRNVCVRERYHRPVCRLGASQRYSVAFSESVNNMNMQIILSRFFKTDEID